MSEHMPQLSNTAKTAREIALAWAETDPHHVVACLRACAGIPTEHLEAGCFAKVLEVLADRQRAECEYECSKLHPGDHWEECTEMRAALAPFQKDKSNEK